jgi:hypothetical protein
VNASNKAPIVDPQGVQPENSTGRAALLEEMRLRCADHLDVPRFLAFSEDGDFALFERRGSNEDWLSIGVTSISKNICWHFGWNSRRVSFCDDSRDLQRRHPEIFGWVVQVLVTMASNFRAYHYDWYTRDRIAKLSVSTSSFLVFGETMARALGDDGI